MVGWKNFYVIGILAGGVTFIIFFIIAETRIKNPIFVLSLPILFYLIELRQIPESKVGLILIASPIIVMAVAPIAGYISDRFDTRYISSAGMAVIALGLYLISNVKVDTKIFIIIIYTMVIGFGIGIFQTPNNSAIMGSVPESRRGTASSMLATMRNLGMVLGIVISGTLFNSRLNKLTEILSAEGYTGTELTNRAFTGAMRTALLIATALAFVAIFTSLIRGSLNKKPNK